MMLSAVAPPMLATRAGWVATITLVITPSARWTSAVAATSAQIATCSRPSRVMVRRGATVAMAVPPVRSAWGWTCAVRRRGLVGGGDHTRAEPPAVEQLEDRPLVEEALPAPEHDRMDHEAALVDEAVLQQRAHQLAAAGDQDVLARLLLQLRHLRGDVPADDARVGPLGLVQGRRDDVLGHRVHPVGEADVVGHRRPGLGEALVGQAPQELRVAGEQLVELELGRLLAPERERPLARLLEHPVE